MDCLEYFVVVHKDSVLMPCLTKRNAFAYYIDNDKYLLLVKFIDVLLIIQTHFLK